MNILLVYPEFPDTFWSFKHALKFIKKKVSSQPLGLLTVAALLPRSWNKVVFPCGYTIGDDGDTINMYYGAADTSIALATGSIQECLNWLISQ